MYKVHISSQQTKTFDTKLWVPVPKLFIPNKTKALSVGGGVGGEKMKVFRSLEGVY